jgi:hypothetical protein
MKKLVMLVLVVNGTLVILVRVVHVEPQLRVVATVDAVVEQMEAAA